jgi:hypothetical protein
MNIRDTIIQGMQSIHLRYVNAVLIVLFALIAFFRKYLTGRDEILDIILGSLPNFIAVFVISIMITDRKKVVGIYKYIIILTVTSLLVLEEFFPTFTGNKIFDLYDILASILGGLFAIILTLFYNSKKPGTTSKLQ